MRNPLAREPNAPFTFDKSFLERVKIKTRTSRRWRPAEDGDDDDEEEARKKRNEVGPRGRRLDCAGERIH